VRVSGAGAVVALVCAVGTPGARAAIADASRRGGAEASAAHTGGAQTSPTADTEIRAARARGPGTGRNCRPPIGVPNGG
jgi:hypothetical protein